MRCEVCSIETGTDANFHETLESCFVQLKTRSVVLEKVIELYRVLETSYRKAAALLEDAKVAILEESKKELQVKFNIAAGESQQSQTNLLNFLGSIAAGKITTSINDQNDQSDGSWSMTLSSVPNREEFGLTDDLIKLFFAAGLHTVEDSIASYIISKDAMLKTLSSYGYDDIYVGRVIEGLRNSIPVDVLNEIDDAADKALKEMKEVDQPAANKESKHPHLVLVK